MWRGVAETYDRLADRVEDRLRDAEKRIVPKPD
jgi:hypothetical protein